jgi:hypothetical protein
MSRFDYPYPPYLPRVWHDLCLKRQTDYQAELKKGNQGAQYSSHGIEDDLGQLVDACCAECFFALYAGLDPLVAKLWENKPDRGHDLVAWRLRWEVKNCQHRQGRYLCWPIRKNDRYIRTEFDALVLVTGRHPLFNVVGYASKTKFWRDHHVADPDHPHLDQGTWYLDAEAGELWKVDPVSHETRC